jgi:hypothetical protein
VFSAAALNPDGCSLENGGVLLPFPVFMIKKYWV